MCHFAIYREEPITGGNRIIESYNKNIFKTRQLHSANIMNVALNEAHVTHLPLRSSEAYGTRGLRVMRCGKARPLPA